MRGPDPKFSPFPWSAVRRLSQRDAALESVLARWLRAQRRVDTVLGMAVTVERLAVVAAPHADPNAAHCEVRVAGLAMDVAGSSQVVRALTTKLLGGPDELAAPRPLTEVESGMWCAAVATWLDAAGVAGEVWPAANPTSPTSMNPTVPLSRSSPPGAVANVVVPSYVEAVLATPFGPMTVVASVPPGAPLVVGRSAVVGPRVPGRIVVARAEMAVADAHALGVRDVVIVERALSLVVGRSLIALAARPGAVVATVATEYVRAAMVIADDARMELTVELGSTELSLRELADLAVGSVVPLGRPLGGPFELRVAGRRIGTGELIDVEGELGVRVLTLDLKE